jgi:transposase
MDVIHAKCAGLDVHQKTIVACARLMTGKTVQHQLQTFGTTTDNLLALGDWLARHEVTHVAMESTGVYWKPVWHALEGQFELLLANPMHVRNVPGRKSDVKTTLVQAAWSAVRKDGTYFRAQFLRLKARRGPKKAIVAVAASILTAAYHVLQREVDYHDLGGDYFSRRDKVKLAKRLIARLHDLGVTVEVKAA